MNDVLALNFILDTGASEVVVPADVALTLVRTGTVQEADFLPGAKYTLADGSVINSPRFVIRSLRIGTREITNVSASVGNVSSYLLIGQNVLGRFGAWGIDNTKKMLILGAEVSDGDRATSAISLTGSWHGMWNSSRVAARGALGAHFQHAGLALKGQAIITDSTCFARGQVFGSVIGEVVVLRADLGRGQWADLTGTITPNGKRMGGQYIINGGPCGGDVGTWSFTSI